MPPAKLRQFALAAGAASAVAAALYVGLVALPGDAAGKLRGLIGILAALALGASLMASDRLARMRKSTLSEPARAVVETVASGIAFLYLLYHLSHVLKFAGPVALAIDALIPAGVQHLLSLLPGIGAMALAEFVWRRTPHQDRDAPPKRRAASERTKGKPNGQL